MTTNPKLIRFADCIPLDIEDYDQLTLEDKAYFLAKTSFDKLLQSLAIKKTALRSHLTDFISIDSASVTKGGGYGYSMKIANRLGFNGLQSHLVDTGGASIASSLGLAAQLITANPKAGVLLVAADAPKSALTSVADLKLINETTLQKEYELNRGATLLGMYALMAQRELFESNKTVEDFLTINEHYRLCASANERAVRNSGQIEPKEKKRAVASPYLPPMVAVVSDHGCAWLMVGPENDLYQESGVYVRGWSQNFHTEYFCFKEPAYSPAVLSGKRALEMAGVQSSDLDYAWLYDCFTGMMARQATAIFDNSYALQVDHLKMGEVSWEGKSIPVNQDGGLMNVQAAMSLSGACGLVDVSKRMNFYANTDASPGNKTCSLLLGNGGVDSVNAAIVLSSSPGRIHAIEGPYELPFNEPPTEKFQGFLYSYTKVLLAPGSPLRAPYILAQVKNPQGQIWMGPLFSNRSESVDERDLKLDETRIQVKADLMSAVLL